jgi:adenosylhomocysteine nucleosidase
LEFIYSENKVFMESSICILGAVKEEIAGIKGRMKIDRKSKLGTADVFYGTWERRPIILVRTGIGRIRAGGALAMVLDKYSLSMVISIGYAGGTHPDIKAGDLLVARQFLSFPKDGEPPKKTNVPLLLAEQAEKVPPSKKFSAYKGRLLTMDRVVNKPEDKRALGVNHMVNAIDMETSVLAQMAAVRKVPFLSVRAITDTVNEELVDVSSFMEKDGQVSTLKAGWYVLTHPGALGKLISLQEIARRGTKNITEFLIAFLKLVN